MRWVFLVLINRSKLYLLNIRDRRSTLPYEVQKRSAANVTNGHPFIWLSRYRKNLADLFDRVSESNEVLSGNLGDLAIDVCKNVSA